MRGWAIVSVLAYGCSFHAAGAPAATGDAGTTGHDDATGMNQPIDAASPSHAACAVTATGGVGSAGVVGGTGGSPDPGMTIACTNATDVIVGVAVYMSDQNTVYGAPSADGFAIVCASLTIAADGSTALGSSYSVSAMGQGTDNWTPATWTAPTMCGSGAVVTGLDVHTGPNNNIFDNVALRCTDIGSGGDATGSSGQIYVAGTNTDDQNNTSAECGSGRALREVLPHDGAGLDAVELHCGATACN
jgi:hypothetical protein